MKKKKRQTTGLKVALLIALGIFLLVKHFHIRNFHTVEPEMLYTSAQPRRMDYTRMLYRYHIATIVNLRSPDEHRERNWYNEEITWVRSSGVRYFELPVRRDNYFPDEHTQQEFLKIMNDKTNLPVLLHGSGGEKRVPMLTAVWLIKNRGYSLEDTLKIVDKLNDDRKITDSERQFITHLAD